ncbi:IclR family transcriptional regulator [Neorhizobium sp. IRAMC:178]|uniref:IclR family transcriptional regulator n=1 Tax=Neorhizobium tunisiense TaxID=3144793 RepID=UPI0031F60985
MSSRSRGIAILELLTGHPWGLSVTEIADQLAIPAAATVRVLSSLVASGYVHGSGKDGYYRLSPKLPALGLAFLGASGVTDLVQPILDDLAKKTGELVRIAIISTDKLTWVAKSQGARSGLLYDPEAAADVYLPASANGQAWLCCLPDAEIRRLVNDQDINRPGFGSGAPQTFAELMKAIEIARQQGYASVRDSYAVGTSAMAIPIMRRTTRRPIGTLSVAGPTMRMTEARMREIFPWLQSSAKELEAASGSSPLFSVQ